MEIRRCMQCMRPYAPGERKCPVCGNVHGLEQAPAYALRPGTILHGTYLVGTVLGQGGFGITYVGFDLVLEAKVAIKEFYPMATGAVSRDNTRSTAISWTTGDRGELIRSKGIESFLREARKLEKLHAIDNVVGVRTQFTENNTAYIVMDFVEGETLKSRLNRTGALTFDACVELLTPVMQALDRVHALGIIHRDISPDNIMVRPDGSLWILDLGAAKEIDLSDGRDWTAQSSQLICKHGFSPAEQYMKNGTIGTWTDVYAMAATVYYCVTATLPPQATDRMFTDGLACLPPLTPGQFSVLRSAMALNPTERIPNMQELLRCLRSTQDTWPQTVLPPQPMAEPVQLRTAQLYAQPRSTPKKRRRSAATAAAWLGIVGMLAAIVIVSVFISSVLLPAQHYSAAMEQMQLGRYAAAIAEFRKAEDYRDSSEQILECQFQERLQQMTVDGYVRFGTWEQDADTQNGTEAIEWLVLDRQGSQVLLLSRYALDAQPYNNTYADAPWKKCSLRSWLNRSFYDGAFTPEEHSAIRMIAVDNSAAQGYERWNTDGGENTRDRVFLLSAAEVNRYFGVTYENSSNFRSRTVPTPYAARNAVFAGNDGNAGSWWWLRSPGSGRYTAAGVLEDGSLGCSNVSSGAGFVRPAVWIDLDAVY